MNTTATNSAHRPIAAGKRSLHVRRGSKTRSNDRVGTRISTAGGRAGNCANFFENWNRYYDPMTGRYLASEPVLNSPRLPLMVATNIGTALPTYSYAGSSPTYYVDKDGLLFPVLVAVPFALGTGISVGEAALAAGVVTATLGVAACWWTGQCGPHTDPTPKPVPPPQPHGDTHGNTGAGAGANAVCKGGAPSCNDCLDACHATHQSGEPRAMEEFCRRLPPGSRAGPGCWSSALVPGGGLQGCINYCDAFFCN